MSSDAIGTLTVTTTAQKLLSEAVRGASAQLRIVNTSNTTLYVAYGDLNGRQLTTANGEPIEPNGRLQLSGRLANKSVWGIHAGTGDKTARYQYA